jgi:hypothetical protein
VVAVMRKCETCLFWQGNDGAYSAPCDHVFGGSGKVPHSHVCTLYVANGKQVLAASSGPVECVYCHSKDVTTGYSGTWCNFCAKEQP